MGRRSHRALADRGPPDPGPQDRLHTNPRRRVPLRPDLCAGVVARAVLSAAALIRRDRGVNGPWDVLVSIQLMAKVFQLPIPSTEKLVLLAMADHARDDGTGCYPSIDTLARKSSLTRRGVQKIMRRL